MEEIMGKTEGASPVEEGMADDSLRANSSDFIGDMIEGDDNPETTTTAVEAATSDHHHHHEDELTAEEKKEADIRMISPSSVPQSKEVVDSSSTNVSGSHGNKVVKAATTSNPPPLPAVVVGGGSSSTVTFKFSYEPREYEQEYYDQLFYHVASTTSNIPAAPSSSKETIIVSPKEAAKLFYTSGVPPERLRMIWNMATLPSSPLPSGAKPPPSMTYGQFRVAVRLIQLFQNRVAAVDEQLNISPDGEGGAASTKSDNRLAPAYFNGVSGEIIPLPKNITTVDATKSTNGVVHNPSSKSNGVTTTTRQLSTNEEKKPPPSSSNGRMNGNNNMPPYNNNETYAQQQQPMPLAEMEREIRRLSAMVSTLQREVEELKRDKAYYNNNIPTPRNNVVADDEDPSVDVEIYWGARRKEKEQQQQQSPDKRANNTTPRSSELPMQKRASTSSINLKSSMPTTHPPQQQFAPPMNNRRNSRSRLSQSQNIPMMHPSSSRRSSKGHLGITTPVGGGASGSTVQVSQQPMKIPEETEDGEESLTAQMHAVRRTEEFDTLLSHAKDRMEGGGGDGGSNAGNSRQSNRSGSFRAVRLNQSMVMQQQQQRNPNGNRPNRPAELAASARHIVRDKEGKVEVYSREEVEPPSTKAVDLAPLNPPPLQYSYEELSSQAAATTTTPQKHRRSLIGRGRW